MFKVDVICFFDIFLNDAYILSRSGLTGSYGNSIIFQVDEVYYSIQIEYLLMLTMRKLAWFKIISVLLLLIKIMICFLKGSLVVIFIFSLTIFDLLLISTIFLGNRVGNTSLIWMMSSILIFKVWVYNFLLFDLNRLEGKV